MKESRTHAVKDFIKTFGILLCLGAGVVIGGRMAGTPPSAGARDRTAFHCEHDKCGRFRGCADAGAEETTCVLHSFGCGTIPCGMSMASLADFQEPRSVELWMAFGPAAILPLTEYVGDNDYPHRLKALGVLARMAHEWDTDKLDPEVLRALRIVATHHTFRPLGHIEPSQRVAALMHGIDLAAALGTPFLNASVRALQHPDTVRARLRDDNLDYQTVVRHARRVR